MLARRHTPSFCFIAPVAYLDKYATQSQTHLVLAHLVDTNQQYAEFYYNLALRNRTLPDHEKHYIIMDNGAFELGESYDPKRLVELGLKCGADALVLPDYPGQPATKTIEAAEKYAPLFKNEGFDTMYVPQSRKGLTNEWIEAYSWGTGNNMIDIIGMSILGIPNALPKIPAAYARVVMTQMLIDRQMFDFSKYHHYLGLNSGPALELPPLIAMVALDSCDSSGPIWSAINGVRYDVSCDSYMPISKKYLREVDFEEKLSKKQWIHDAIKHNIDSTLQLFEQS